MKKYLITSLLFFIPLMATAADHCTAPDKYTVDKRCYVTDEIKEKHPYYNAAVAVIKNEDITCTGTIVKGEEGKPYFYTAKHCVSYRVGTPDAYNDLYVNTLKIKLQNNAEYEVKKYKVYNKEDFAVYQFSDKDVAAVKSFAVEKTMNKNSKNAIYDARLVGYGKLKIMSDDDIEKFKDKYEKYLEDKGLEKDYFFNGHGGVNAKYQDFLFLGKEWEDLAKDQNRLKESICNYYVNYGADGCQGWGGNSGGPIFDEQGRIMAIATNGSYTIGGDNHARVAGGKAGTSKAGSVSLLKEESSEKK